jgi:hypothetical protein
MQLLAGVLTVYAMGGVLLVTTMLGSRDPRLNWALVAAGAGLFAVSAGTAALAVWRAERHAPIALVVSGVLGAGVCLALPAAAPAALVSPEMWRSAALGGALFAAFLFLAAVFVRRHLRARGAGGPRHR